MQPEPSNRPPLPSGWYPTEGEAQGLHAELQRELPPGHLLFGRTVETFAYRRDQDDVLFRHQNESDRFTVIHLTWIRKQEINAEHLPISRRESLDSRHGHAWRKSGREW